MHHPHDSLFKLAFSEPATAAATLQAHLPAAIAALLDFSQVAVEPGSWVDPEFRHKESDLLYRIPLLGRAAFVYVLFEHQSRRDRWLPLRLLGYMLAIWAQFRRDHPRAKRLPVIVPLVLAQCERAWKLSPRFASLFELGEAPPAELRRCVPDFTHGLLELAGLSWSELRGLPFGVAVLRAMKAQRSGETLGPEVWDEELLRQLTAEQLGSIVRYILGSGGVDLGEVRAKMKTLRDVRLRNDAMTAAQQLINEGIETGKQLGIETGWQRGIEEGLEKGELIGYIRLRQSNLGQPQTPRAALATQSLAELQALWAGLQAGA